MNGDEREDAERRAKQRLLGNIRLISELLNKSMVGRGAAGRGRAADLCARMATGPLPGMPLRRAVCTWRRAQYYWGPPSMPPNPPCPPPPPTTHALCPPRQVNDRIMLLILSDLLGGPDNDPPEDSVEVRHTTLCTL